MGFYETLDQILDLLRQRGRVTYRALQREFNLDDTFLFSCPMACRTSC